MDGWPVTQLMIVYIECTPGSHRGDALTPRRRCRRGQAAAASAAAAANPSCPPNFRPRSRQTLLPAPA